MDEIRMGKEAQAVLENEAMKAAAQAIRDSLYKEFETLDDMQGSDARAWKLRFEAQGLNELRVRLQRMVDVGKKAEREKERNGAEN